MDGMLGPFRIAGDFFCLGCLGNFNNVGGLGDFGPGLTFSRRKGDFSGILIGDFALSLRVGEAGGLLTSTDTSSSDEAERCRVKLLTLFNIFFILL